MDQSKIKAVLVQGLEYTCLAIFAFTALWALFSGSYVGALLAGTGALLSTAAGRNKFLPPATAQVEPKVLAIAGGALMVLTLIFGGIAAFHTAKSEEAAAAAKAATAVELQKAEKEAAKQRELSAEREKAERKAELKKLELRMDELFAIKRASSDWDIEALEIAKLLNRSKPTDTPELFAKWRSNPAVVAASGDAVRLARTAASKEIPKVIKQTQLEYAEKLDRILLNNRVEARVDTSGLGTKSAAITIRSVLVGRVFADQLANKADMENTARAVRFSKIHFVNPISEERWTYDLGTPDIPSTLAAEVEVQRKWAIEDL